jgi:hypothetical protein
LIEQYIDCARQSSESQAANPLEGYCKTDLDRTAAIDHAHHRCSTFRLRSLPLQPAGLQVFVVL